MEALPEEQRKQAEMLLEFHKNPLEAGLSYLKVSDSMKSNIMSAKSMYDDPYMISAFIKDKVPDEYKDLVDKAEQGVHYAVELKAQKDKIMIDYIEKGIMPLISIYDTNKDGVLQKEECEELCKGLLDQLKMRHMFNQLAFDTLYNQFDQDKKGYLEPRKLAELIHLLAFQGM